MAAFAAVVSVMNNIELIQNHPIHSFSFDKKQIEHVHENVCFLLEFLESYPHGCSKEGEALESLIASAAHEADDVIESHVVDQIQAGSTLNGNTSSCFFENLQKVIENLDSVKEMAMKVKANGRFKDHMYNTMPTAASTPLTAGKNVMVGFDDELTHLMDVLTGQQFSLQSISITGMGGMGKTTLAKHVYEHSIIFYHFDIRAWATISQDFSTRKILSELLSCQGKSTSELDQKTENELGELLRQKFLWNRRYLIVLDDIWSKEAWDNMKDFFPDNQNGSRIVVTSRQLDVANHLSSLCLPMKFLDDEKSWNLFCEKTFAEQGCPLELEKIGKKIVKKSRGLPLLIVLIGGQLRKSPPMKEYWENVANDITLIWDSGEAEQSLDVLSLSYSYLPAHLKPCFLYMGVFPEDKDISVSMLVKLWIAEGFIKPSKTESLEEVAEGCLKDLADRNLVLVREWTWNGKIKTCNIHDVLRELCLKIAMEKNFFYVVKKLVDAPELMKERRVVVHGSIVEKKDSTAINSAAITRSVICEGGALSFDYRLLKVMKEVRGRVRKVGESCLEIEMKQVNLRYLHVNFLHQFSGWSPSSQLHCLPSSMSMLWNLQTLIFKVFDRYAVAPSEIWKMPQLRHVMVTYISLPDPPSTDQQNDDLLPLQNLTTLSHVMNFRLSEDICESIPNIKELDLFYTSYSLKRCDATSHYSPHNLGCFKKLQSLSCIFPVSPESRCFAVSFTFPSSLHKLCLQHCHLRWDDLSLIGCLPHLEVVELQWKSVVGPEWSPVEGEFFRLKSLSIAGCGDLVHWNAESRHFPVLEKLLLYELDKLKEIPLSMGDIPTLGFISLMNCSVSAAISAARILVEQQGLENEGLQLEIIFRNKIKLERFKEMVQVEGLSTNNLHIK